PRVIPSFCRYGHGRLQERTDLREMFAAATTAMARRGQEWTPGHAELYLGLYEQTAAVRSRVLRENEQSRLRRVVCLPEIAPARRVSEGKDFPRLRFGLVSRSLLTQAVRGSGSRRREPSRSGPPRRACGAAS